VPLFDRLQDVHRRWDVLRHPFYQRWSEGTLTRDELATYAGEYRHAVIALADASERAAELAEGSPASTELREHAAEERAHVALWDDFAGQLGAEPDVPATAETEACAVAWAGGDRTLLGHLTALYAIESAQPAIAEVKRDGLVERYDFEPGRATAYFDVHTERDHAHAASARALIEQRLAGADEDALVAEAEAVLRANWELLDGVDRLAAAAA
jgi:pyrroloquinoline-quinone synthase